MQDLQVGSLTFNFPNSWQVSKYDEWDFYRNQFLKMLDGIKAVDLIAIENQVVWLIEAKDYRSHRREKTISLVDEVAKKVVWTLSAMIPAKINASNSFESNFAKDVCNTTKVRIVLHLEQSVKTSKLFPRAVDPTKVQLKLRTLIKPIDPHPKVVESTQMQNLAWTVT